MYEERAPERACERLLGERARARRQADQLAELRGVLGAWRSLAAGEEPVALERILARAVSEPLGTA